MVMVIIGMVTLLLNVINGKKRYMIGYFRLLIIINSQTNNNFNITKKLRTSQISVEENEKDHVCNSR